MTNQPLPRRIYVAHYASAGCLDDSYMVGTNRRELCSEAGEYYEVSASQLYRNWQADSPDGPLYSVSIEEITDPETIEEYREDLTD